MSDDSRGIAELIGEVRKLEGTNAATARVVRNLQGDVVALDGRFAENTEQLRRRTRNTLVLVVVVLIALAAVTFVGTYTVRYFNCRNAASERFFSAEHDKVAGQIQGIKDRSIEEFTTASQHYLDTIARINNQC